MFLAPFLKFRLSQYLPLKGARHERSALIDTIQSPPSVSQLASSILAESIRLGES